MRIWLAVVLVVAVSSSVLWAAAKLASPTEPAAPDPVFLSPEESMARIQVPDGYRVELVASEPMLHEPAMIAWDGNGRMFVAELNTYMQDIDGKNQHRPVCQVKILEDTNGDGTMDKMTVFADDLVLPRMIVPLNDRVLIRETNTDDVYAFFDDNGDGKADRREFAFRAPGGSGGNLEHQDSAMMWSIDNWLYSAMGHERHRLVDGEWVSEPVSHEFSQWGLTQDEVGQLYYASAGREAAAYGFQQHPKYGRLSVDGELTADFNTVYPIVQTPDVQGGPGRVGEHGTLNHFTGHCGQSIFLGHRMPDDFRGNYFLPEPVGRLVRRAKVHDVDGKRVLENAYEGREFMASTDMNFRPVWSAGGPDGTLYVVDMYRGIIQEGNWVGQGSYLRPQVEKYKLDENIGRGRIYRVVHESVDRDAERPRMLDESPKQLLKHLHHPNGWWRMEAQKLIVLSGDQSVVPALEEMASNAEEPLARVHALWTLEGLDALKEQSAFAALSDEDPRVRQTAIRLVEPLLENEQPQALEQLAKLAGDEEPRVLAQLLNTLRYAETEGRPLILQVMEEHAENDLLIAVGSDAMRYRTGGEGDELADITPSAVQSYIRGRDIYGSSCVACHAPDGKGQASGELLLGPSMVESQHLGSSDAAVRVVLHGSVAGITEGKYQNMMAPMKAQDDQWIADVLTYARIAFGGFGAITPERVAEVRQTTSERQIPYTSGELHRFLRIPTERMAAWEFDASHNAGALGNMIDGKSETRWDTGAQQQPGMWVTIDLQQPHDLTGLVLDTRGSQNDYPRGFTVSVSDDGENWTKLVEGEGDGPSTEIVLPDRTVAQHVRLEQTGRADGLFWSVHRLIVTGEPSESQQDR